MDSEVKNYELAYILSPVIPEDAVLSAAGELTAVIEKGGGMVRRAETPKKRRLAYAIHKHDQGYFGWTTFAMEPKLLPPLAKKIAQEKNIIRHLIVEEEIETRTPFVRPLGSPARTESGMHALPSQGATPEEPAEKLDLEALDKKLEEILGK